jgi:hypothetical protein
MNSIFFPAITRNLINPKENEKLTMVKRSHNMTTDILVLPAIKA